MSLIAKNRQLYCYCFMRNNVIKTHSNLVACVIETVKLTRKWIRTNRIAIVLAIMRLILVVIITDIVRRWMAGATSRTRVGNKGMILRRRIIRGSTSENNNGGLGNFFPAFGISDLIDRSLFGSACGVGSPADAAAGIKKSISETHGAVDVADLRFNIGVRPDREHV